VNLNTLSKTKLNKSLKAQRVIFLRVAPELHTALKAQAKSEGATINKFLTKQIEQISAAATLRK
jgi:predicted DNA binding CopG/RHH family protein